MKTYNPTLDAICNIANTYDITPHKALTIYNLYINKDYTDNISYAIKLTRRYVKLHYKKIDPLYRWEHINIIDFQKKYAR